MVTNKPGHDDDIVQNSDAPKARVTTARLQESIDTNTQEDSKDDDDREGPSTCSSLGSQRRRDQLLRRSSCNQHSQLWRRASLRTSSSPANSLRASTRRQRSLLKSSVKTSTTASTKTSSTLETLTEGVGLDSLAELAKEFEGYDLDNEEEEESLDGDEKAEEIEKEKQFLATRRASQNIYQGEGFEVDEAEILSMYLDKPQHYDPWENQTDENGIEFDFSIIGTSVDDINALPHVLSPPLIDSLQVHLPFAKQGQNCWLKYSLVRDGADFNAFLKNTHDNEYTILAIETVEGEVFGSFTRSSWRLEPDYYGSGEAFLWRMKGSRADVLGSVFEQAHRETQIDVYPYSFQNKFIQMCQSNRIAVGGGTTTESREIATGEVIPAREFGFGICFDEGTLLYATSSPCLTFNSPSLSDQHQDGSRFEVLNLEVWTFTPCITLKEAEIMEEKQRFLRANSSTISD